MNVIYDYDDDFKQNVFKAEIEGYFKDDRTVCFNMFIHENLIGEEIPKETKRDIIFETVINSLLQEKETDYWIGKINKERFNEFKKALAELKESKKTEDIERAYFLGCFGKDIRENLKKYSID